MSKQIDIPAAAREVRERLINVFPDFAEHCPLEDIYDSMTTAPVHAVMRCFCEYFGGAIHKNGVSPEQLKGLAALLNKAVADNDIVENAVSTCLLEHLGQVRGYKPLASLLSADARRRCRA